MDCLLNMPSEIWGFVGDKLLSKLKEIWGFAEKQAAE